MPLLQVVIPGGFYAELPQAQGFPAHFKAFVMGIEVHGFKKLSCMRSSGRCFALMQRSLIITSVVHAEMCAYVIKVAKVWGPSFPLLPV